MAYLVDERLSDGGRFRRTALRILDGNTSSRGMAAIRASGAGVSAALCFELVEEQLDEAARAYARSHVGFVDTVIGRMVPPPTPEMLAEDPSRIMVEPYRELPVDRQAYVGAIPAPEHRP